MSASANPKATAPYLIAVIMQHSVLADRWGSEKWEATGVVHDHARLLSTTLAALDRRYGEWLSSGFTELRVEWRKRASMLGQRVRMRDGGEGVAVDVDDTGALLVDAGLGALTRVVSAGADSSERCT
jgi:biotin-(acetyl-CoA carboxylase) ligase